MAEKEEFFLQYDAAAVNAAASASTDSLMARNWTYIGRSIHETVTISDFCPSLEIRFPEREALQMTSPAEYRRRARQFLQMAQNCQDSQIAARLRAIATDYLDAAQSAVGAFQQQQQVQPDEDAE